VLQQMSLDNPTQLIHEIYYRDLHRHAIAAPRGLVQHAADAGDAVARRFWPGRSTELVYGSGPR
jgi:hypothetical protein